MSVTLYIDIETAPEFEEFDQMPPDGQASFTKKFRTEVEKLKYATIQEAYKNEASLYAEWSRIICLGVGCVIKDSNDEGKEKFYVKGLIGTEDEIFTAFLKIIEHQSPNLLVAHLGKIFDFPFLCRRLMIKRYVLPPILNTRNKKPWDVLWECTAEMWSCTDKKHYVSLITMAYVFGIPSPKVTLDGSKVMAAWFEGKINEIKEYCIDDVFTLGRIHRKLLSLPDITEIIRK
ncbi:MAG TPA: ribonuclease H-like domain-containing protein [Sphingobacteriaceae bacterium]